MAGSAQTNTHSRDDDEQKKRQRAANSENQSSVIWTDSTRTNDETFQFWSGRKNERNLPVYGSIAPPNNNINNNISFDDLF